MDRDVTSLRSEVEARADSLGRCRRLGMLQQISANVRRARQDRFNDNYLLSHFIMNTISSPGDVVRFKGFEITIA